MKKRITRLIDTSTWVASTDLAGVNLPRSGYITEVTIRANITATLTAAAYEDYFRRVIASIKIQGDGGRSYVGFGGDQLSRMVSLQQEIMGGFPTLHSNGSGIALAVPDVASATFISTFKLHFGNNWRDPFDLSAAIPAMKLSTLQILLSTTAAAVTDAAGTITAATFNYEVAEVIPEAGEVIRCKVPQGSTLTYAHTANYSDFGYTIDVPTGAWLRSILMCSNDDTATVNRRKSDEVTHVKLWKPKTGEIVLESGTYELGAAMMARFGCPGIAGETGPLGAIADLGPRPGSLQSIVPSGFRIIDLRPFTNSGFGLDLRNYQTGDYKLGLTIANYAAGDDTVFYWDQLTD